ncbi:hypothetical protein FA15DRAFT_674269 [Coprinopsis marcescibilis]|uniref:Mediator of RNA polymerase II transcription subunit 8 n=1 Tax=Coprinopsis marcescibilis TaxID=230819 RepID=A0A5C3KHT3_COPMA|nr:hypothetical protein FA15DRAFT_674269 [Coprinopsis marcescibilis]
MQPGLPIPQGPMHARPGTRAPSSHSQHATPSGSSLLPPLLQTAHLPISQLESLRFKANQIIDAIFALYSMLMSEMNPAYMPSWPEILSKYNVILSQTHNFSNALLNPFPSSSSGGLGRGGGGGGGGAGGGIGGTGAGAGGQAENIYHKIAVHPNMPLKDPQTEMALVNVLVTVPILDVYKQENEIVRRLSEHMAETRGMLGALGIASGVGPGGAYDARVNGFGLPAARKPEYEEVLRECARIREAHDERCERAVRAVAMLREQFDMKARVEDLPMDEPEEHGWDHHYPEPNEDDEEQDEDDDGRSAGDAGEGDEEGDEGDDDVGMESVDEDEGEENNSEQEDEVNIEEELSYREEDLAQTPAEDSQSNHPTPTQPPPSQTPSPTKSQPPAQAVPAPAVPPPPAPAPVTAPAPTPAPPVPAPVPAPATAPTQYSPPAPPKFTQPTQPQFAQPPPSQFAVAVQQHQQQQQHPQFAYAQYAAQFAAGQYGYNPYGALAQGQPQGQQQQPSQQQLQFQAQLHQLQVQHSQRMAQQQQAQQQAQQQQQQPATSVNNPIVIDDDEPESRREVIDLT